MVTFSDPASQSNEYNSFVTLPCGLPLAILTPTSLRIPDFERSAPKRRALTKNLNCLVGRGGLGHASATPKIHDCKHSLHRNVSLRIATGNPHSHVLYIYYINLVGKGGLEPPHPCGYQILSLTRLPFRHSPNKLIKYIKLLILLTL